MENTTQPKIKILAFPEFVGKPRQELYDHLFKEKIPLATVEMRDYWAEHPKEIPEELKDGNWHYYFGSLFRDHDGDLNVPCSYWDGESLYCYAIWLRDGWHGGERVVARETLPSDIDPLDSAPCFSALCSSHCKEYKVFGLDKEGKCHGFTGKKWKIL